MGEDLLRSEATMTCYPQNASPEPCSDNRDETAEV